MNAAFSFNKLIRIGSRQDRITGDSGALTGRELLRRSKVRKREKGVDAFACNQVRLLLAGFGYQIMHLQRALLERVTGTGWSLRRLADRVLRTPARFALPRASPHRAAGSR